MVEEQIAKKVMKVLGPIYGNKNVHVSASAQINMEQLIREVTTYNTPEKIDQNDKLESWEKRNYTMRKRPQIMVQSVLRDRRQMRTRRNITQMAKITARAKSESVSREYLVIRLKSRDRLVPGALEDLTVSVAINQNGLDI